MTSRTATLLCGLLAASLAAGQNHLEGLAEQHWLYWNGPEQGCEVQSWNQLREERDGTAPSKFLWLNADWQAKPWAGTTVKGNPQAPLILTAEWLSKGFVRFLINGGLDRYGSPNGNLRFQLRPLVEGTRYQQLRPRYIERARGLDEDDATWQSALVPLSYWTDLKPGDEVAGLSLQCYAQPERPYGFAELGFVRYAELPAWMAAGQSEEVSQPEVTWPAYADLPPLLRTKEQPLTVRDAKYVTPDGHRVFMLNPYCREDPRLDVWGNTSGEKKPSAFGLFDPATQGWIYEELPTAETLCRLGFNSYSATMVGQPWWSACGYSVPERSLDATLLPGYAKRVGLPFYIDTVAWPWTVGKPGEDPGNSKLPADAITQGRNHWTQYRIGGAGREAWLTMWRAYAQHYRDAGVPVMAYELLNEPSYRGVSEQELQAYQAWLQQRYGTVAALNRRWGTDLPDWAAAAAVEVNAKHDSIAGREFDYDEYLTEQFADLVKAGVEAVNQILPGTPTGVQVMGGFALAPREAVWKHKFVTSETLVLTPTGGGRWTSGRASTTAPKSALAAPIAGAPLENDLLLALAGDKMIVDNETYLNGQTARETRNRLWSHVAAGLDGLTVFAWSRRGWAWWKTRAEVQTEADKYPYSSLNPLARRTAALRGILDFAEEVQPLADLLLPKPWGPQPKVGLLYDWADARRRTREPELPDRAAAYYAALKYTHADLAVVPSDQILDGDGLAGLAVLVAPGVRFVEPELLPKLTAWVNQGGVLVVGEDAFPQDLYAQPVEGGAALAGVEVGRPVEGGGQDVKLPDETAARLPGDVKLVSTLREVKLLTGTTVLAADAQGRPVLTKRVHGAGAVYYQAADQVGYPLAKLLWAALSDTGQAGEWRSAELSDATSGDCATNVLLSRRGNQGCHVLLLMNRDEYDKQLTVRVPGLTGQWTVTERLSRKSFGTVTGQELAQRGFELTLAGGDPAVVVLSPAG